MRRRRPARRALPRPALAVVLVAALAATTAFGWAAVASRPDRVDAGDLTAVLGADAPAAAPAPTAGPPTTTPVATTRAPVTTAVAGAPSPTAAAPPTVPPPTAAPPSIPRPGTRSARPEHLPRHTPLVPVGLRIAALDVAAPVDEVGVVAGTAELEIPHDVDRVGWYGFGSDLDDGSGSVVLTAHVDSAEQGPGVFLGLRDLPIGAGVDVEGADGSVHRYRVAARRQYAKTELPADEVFAADGPPRLVLVTCGGEFDRGERSYADNVVVYAVPVDGDGVGPDPS